MVNVLMYFLCTFQPSLHDAVFAKETLKTESVLVLPDIPGEKRIAYTIHEYPLSDQYCILFLSNSTFRDYIGKDVLGKYLWFKVKLDLELF